MSSSTTITHDSFATEFHRLSQQIGAYKQQVSSFESNPPSDLVERAEREEAIFTTGNELGRAVQSMQKMADDANEFVLSSFKVFVDAAGKDLQDCIAEKVMPLFLKNVAPKLEGMNKGFQELSERMSQAVKSRMPLYTYREIRSGCQQLGDRVVQMERWKEKGSVCFNFQQSFTYSQIQGKVAKLLEEVERTTLNYPCALFADLQSAMDKGVKIGPSQEEIRSWNERIDALSTWGEEIPNQIDGQIYSLAPKPKGGPQWGKLHRFDDLGRLKQAISFAFFDSFDHTLRTESPLRGSEEVQMQFYKALQEAAEAADGSADPKEWARHHLILHLRLVEPLIAKMTDSSADD